MTTHATVTGTLYRNSGPGTPVVPWQSAPVVATPILLDESAALVDSRSQVPPASPHSGPCKADPRHPPPQSESLPQENRPPLWPRAGVGGDSCVQGSVGARQPLQSLPDRLPDPPRPRHPTQRRRRIHPGQHLRRH